ncbi:MAG: coproporphyrinogen dehydrogenase HemZ [Clostridiales bacterium]|nr:coproporphyrinogen dehydrogenase HemZ [Clostridiales bacterium]
MRILLVGHDYKYAVEQMLLTLFPSERPEYDASCGSPALVSELLVLSDGRAECVSKMSLEGASYIARRRTDKPVAADAIRRASELSKLIKLSFYEAALASGITPPAWGALTGVRPAKLAEAHIINEAVSPDEAADYLSREFGVSPERASLCGEAAGAAVAARLNLNPDDVSLYAGIPFCPTRCSYCSFVSQSVEKSGALVEPYLNALFREIEAAGSAMRRTGMTAVSLYIGGGTPTVLSAFELAALMEKLRGCMDLDRCREITVEAGRPDTVTRDKLLALKDAGVTRISLNPQTMSDDVLRAVGRRHTAADVRESIELARSIAAWSINMDLIAGLPSDTPDGFKKSLDEVLAFTPENITIHTLALKRGSRLNLEKTPLPGSDEVSQMLSYAHSRLFGSSYSPYYLYRQKYTAGGLENTGWTKPGFACLYNICMMEELHSIISMGAGGVTKLKNASSGKITRLVNKKYPEEYIASVGEFENTARKILSFKEIHDD